MNLKTQKLNIFLHYVLPGLAIFLLLFGLYKISMPAPPFLDERYILSWLKNVNGNVISQSVLSWKGLEIGDTFGILSSSCLSLLASISKDPTSSIRTFSFVLHFINSILVYLVMDRTINSGTAFVFVSKVKWLSAMVAICFALYPIATEAVFYLGGIAYVLGTFFLLLSFLFYFHGKTTRKWIWIISGALLYLLALLSDSSLWSAGFILVGYELSASFIGTSLKNVRIDQAAIERTEDIEDAVEKLLDAERNPDKSSDDSNTKDSAGASEENVFDTLLPALPYLALGAMLPLGSLPKYGTETFSSTMVITPMDWILAFKAFWLPINQSITDGYNPQYSLLYVLYGLALLTLPLAVWRSRKFRQHAVFLIAWLLMALVPHLHHRILNDTMEGARWFYHATIPVSALAILLFSSINFATTLDDNKRMRAMRWAASLFTIILVVIFSVFLFLKTRNQLRFYHTASTLADNLKYAVGAVSSRQNIDFMLVRNIPFNATIAKLTSPFDLIMLDGKTQLIMAPHMVGGKLKDLFKAGKLKNHSFWEHHKKALFPLEFGIFEDELNGPMKADQLDQILVPPASYQPNVSYDREKQLISIFSNQAASPVISMQTPGFDPTGHDFICLKAKIDIPAREADELIEMNWYTTWGKDLERRDRIAESPAITNDGKFHKYYFPIRSTAWGANNRIEKLSFSFPKTASVLIEEIGQVDAAERIPQLTLDKPVQKLNRASYSRGFYNYPTNKDLGLYVVFGEDEVLTFDYDASKMVGAHKVICEISQPNKTFENPNGYSLSKNKLKILHLASLKGKMTVKSKDLKDDGIYSFRIFACDQNENPILNASDEICCLIDKSLSADAK